jgi:hypothetical protein
MITVIIICSVAAYILPMLYMIRFWKTRRLNPGGFGYFITYCPLVNIIAVIASIGE